MNEGQGKSRGSLEYRLAARLFDSAFASFNRLPRVDQELLLQEVMKRTLQFMPGETAVREAPDSSPESARSVRVTGIEIKPSKRSDDEG